MTFQPIVVNSIQPFVPGIMDDALILAASWEDRCLGVAKRITDYRCKSTFITEYDGPNAMRSKNVGELEKVLTPISVMPIETIKTLHADPLPNVLKTIESLKRVVNGSTPRISVDISTFTRKHLLELLQGLDLHGFLPGCQFYYTEPSDYHTQDGEPIGQGIASVKAIETLAGNQIPSDDKVLIIFLGYEGRRAQALWTQIEPHNTVAVIPHPPTHEEWIGRTEDQNKYLLSCVLEENIFKTHSLVVESTVVFLEEFVLNGKYSTANYNFIIAPMGTKAQTVGIYRFWRQHPGLTTVMYASPKRYRQHEAPFPFGRTWLLDRADLWSP